MDFYESQKEQKKKNKRRNSDDFAENKVFLEGYCGKEEMFYQSMMEYDHECIENYMGEGFGGYEIEAKIEFNDWCVVLFFIGYFRI